ncbi:MAG: bifunctional methylenetetrahydrofolate dehydrogenase/methenyltetrahydrofolate cyclohydrolase FolD [Prevotella sp.]|nr:bifunctional methylenetetrahydrofolate dehydrogenase/methenyltetrahydrofolate cyclohydrolase FolD [Prevotella sp.]MCM1475828.1 bifunctional methylenetetrahydrofolate dehydrogenase/methenyltetrahydrofolate cyclohydrolase FolD [Muribaculaceae bacterium]
MIISGSDIAGEIKDSLRSESEECKKKWGRTPHIAVILVGNDPASERYVSNKGKAAADCGFDHTLLHFPESVSEKELLAAVAKLNENPDIDGVLVQLPLPGHISKTRVIDAIDPLKDVDAFHPENVAKLWKKQADLFPCTPKGIIRLLDEASVEIAGKRAVVIGRSNMVGFPVAKMLLDRDATVTIAHSKTKDLAAITREADILVVAIGCAKLITADMVKSGAAVIDVGINRDTETGGMCGDVDFEAIKKKASVITPVPGGVGPMTIACLMENTMECYQREMHKRETSKH